MLKDADCSQFCRNGGPLASVVRDDDNAFGGRNVPVIKLIWLLPASGILSIERRAGLEILARCAVRGLASQ